MSVIFEGLADAGDEGGGVEFGAENLVGAVGEDGDAPVAEEGDELVVMRGLDFGAEPLGGVDALFAFDVDEDEVRCLLAEERETLVDVTGGFDSEAGEAEDLVTDGRSGRLRAQLKVHFSRRCQ